MNIDLTIKELYRIFDFFNARLYSNKLEHPVILIQTNGKHKSTMGWCTSRKIWNDSEGSESYYELTVCAEYLNMSMEEVIGTMLHEMVHLFCSQFKIKDTSRAGTYHNKRFKTAAEEIGGLLVDRDEKIGWGFTRLHEDTVGLIDELDPCLELFRIARRYPENYTPSDDEELAVEEDKPKRSSTRKYICPECGTIIRATKEVNVLCGDCNVPFEMEQPEDDEDIDF